MTTTKFFTCAWLGAIGGMIASWFGGWSSAMTTLLVFMGIDYISGVILAGVFHRSGKTATGSLSSLVGFKGLCKKMMMMLIVLVAARLDLLLGSDFVRDSTCIALIVNELISIVENAGLMGIPIPGAITKAIDALKAKEDGHERKENP